MIRQPGRIGAANESFETAEMFTREGVGRAEVHRDAVLHYTVLIEDAVEHGKRATTVDHVVLGDDLEPVDDRLLFEDVPVVRHAEADANAVVRESVEAICWHSEILRWKGCSVPPRSRLWRNRT